MNKTLRQILSIGILTLFLTQIGFSQSIEKFVDSTIKADSLNVPTDFNQPYFPKEMFPEVSTDLIKKNDSSYTIKTKTIKGTYDEFVVDWYSKHLHAMKEPLLFNRKIDKNRHKTLRRNQYVKNNQGVEHKTSIAEKCPQQIAL